jgi:hypothetical protein
MLATVGALVGPTLGFKPIGARKRHLAMAQWCERRNMWRPQIIRSEAAVCYAKGKS